MPCDLLHTRSVCSAVGMMPLSLQYGYDIMAEFLAGARAMDNHFFSTPLAEVC